MLLRNHPGKLVCILAVTYFFGFLYGITFGYVLGSVIDWFIRTIRQSRTEHILCATLGKLARSDEGRISEKEIARASEIFAQLGLTGDKRQEAIEHFRRGASPGFDLEAEISALKFAPLANRIHFLQVLIIFSIEHDGDRAVLKPGYYRVLDSIVGRIGINHDTFRIMADALEAQANFQDFGGGDGREEHAYSGRPPRFRGRRDTLAMAYKALGVTENDSDEAVTKAYRRMVNEFHPDKVISKGLGKDTVKLATEKTQQIQAAYKQIKEARGM